MNLLTRLLMNRYKNNYLEIAGFNALITKHLTTHLNNQVYQPVHNEWLRIYPNVRCAIDGIGCGYRIELKKVKDKRVEYRIQLTQKKDAPIFVTVAARRRQLVTEINRHYQAFKERFGFQHYTHIGTIENRHTNFTIWGEIKLD